MIKLLWEKTEGWRLPLLGLIAIIFALFSVLTQTKQPPRKPVTTPPVSPFENTIAGIGVVEPKSELIAISTELPGIVRNIYVTVGDKVQKGTPLFSLDQRDIDAQIATLEASLESAKIQANDTAVQFQLIDSVKDKRAIAKDDHNRRKYAAELSKTKVNEIRGQLNQAKTTKQRLTVLAPIEGTILDINIRPGEFATTGNLAQPLMRIGDISTMHVRVEFDEENTTRLPKDAPAKAYKRGDTSKSYPLTFVRFEPYVKPKRNLAVAGQRVDTRTLEVIYALPSDIYDLFVGQQMDVFVREQSTKDS